MIVIRLWGGLGNQLFQYAYGYSMAKKLGTELRLDCRFFTEAFLSKNPRFTKRKPMILTLPLQYKNTDIPSAIDKTVDFLQQKNTNRLIRIPGRFRMKIPGGFTYVKEGRAHYDRKYGRAGKNLYFDGYWQCEKYFSAYREELLEQLTPAVDTQKLQPLLSQIQAGESVAVHVRRGDYVGNKNPFSSLYLVSKKYYDDCIDKATKQMRSPHFYFFSNDIAWVKENFGDREDFTYVSGMDGLSTMDEFFLMSRCKNQIVGNSTFSWWAAWLNPNKNKTVWAPARWFGNKDIWPKEWHLVHLEDDKEE